MKDDDDESRSVDELDALELARPRPIPGAQKIDASCSYTSTKVISRVLRACLLYDRYILAQ
jgi:hypothetical protein